MSTSKSRQKLFYLFSLCYFKYTILDIFGFTLLMGNICHWWNFSEVFLILGWKPCKSKDSPHCSELKTKTANPWLALKRAKIEFWNPFRSNAWQQIESQIQTTKGDSICSHQIRFIMYYLIFPHFSKCTLTSQSTVEKPWLLLRIKILTQNQSIWS